MRVLKALFVVAIVMAMVVVFVVLRPGFTPGIGPPGVASLERITLGGTPQWVLIRGQNRDNPLVVFLHGGPGMPLMYLAHSFQRELENDFVVVQWDRRGAGKSYSPTIDPKRMRMSQEVADAEQLIDLLRQRFRQTKVIVAGHSYGTLLGIELAYRRPDLVRAYVGVGQVACGDSAAEVIQDAWLRKQAMAAGDTNTLAAIDRGLPFDQEAALFRYGGEVVGMRSYWPLVMKGLLAPEYTLGDALNVSKGVAFTHEHLAYDLLNPSLLLIESVPKLTVPVYLLVGRLDYTTPFTCAEHYYDRLDDASTHLVWFDHSAHFPFLEEPQRVHQALLQVARQTASPAPVAFGIVRDQ